MNTHLHHAMGACVIVDRTAFARRPHQHQLSSSAAILLPLFFFPFFLSFLFYFPDFIVDIGLTKLLFPFPSSTRLRVYPRLASPSAYGAQPPSLAAYALIRSSIALTSTSEESRPASGPSAARKSATSWSKAGVVVGHSVAAAVALDDDVLVVAVAAVIAVFVTAAHMSCGIDRLPLSCSDARVV